MLERLLETTDKEMCPAKKAGKNLESLLETCAVTMDRCYGRAILTAVDYALRSEVG